MDIEKTLDYLENVMSSEVRIMTLEKEIEALQDAYQETDRNLDSFIVNDMRYIILPDFFITDDETTAIRSKMHYENNVFEDCVHNNRRYRNLVDIHDKLVKTVEGLYHKKLNQISYSVEDQNGHCEIKTTLDCVYCVNIRVMEDLKEIINNDITDFFEQRHNDSCYRGFHFTNIQPRQLAPIRYEAFENHIKTYFSGKGYTRGVLELPRFTDYYIEMIAKELYPIYCEQLNETNALIIELYEHLARLSIKYLIRKDVAKTNIPVVEGMLDSEKHTLEQLYGLGVIYEKYRNKFALSSFIDYFASQRCNSFIGESGAYNLYEMELRMDRIVDKLDVIISKLDEIKTNQRAMYFAITEMNDNITSLRGTINGATERITNEIRFTGSSIISQLKDISSNTATMNAKQEFSNQLQKITNDRLDAIRKNQEFQQMLYSDPTLFGGNVITEKARGKYH